MDVEGVKAHLRQSPLSQIIPPGPMAQMFQVADQVMIKQKKAMDDAFDKRKANEKAAKERAAKERAAKLLGENAKDKDDVSTQATTSDKEEMSTKTSAKWMWNEGKDQWKPYTEEDNAILEKAYQEDKQVCKISNRWGEYIVYLRKYERKQKKISSGFERKVRRLPSEEEARLVRELFLGRLKYLRSTVKQSKTPVIVRETEFLTVFLKEMLKYCLQNTKKKEDVQEVKDMLKEVLGGGGGVVEETKEDTSDDEKGNNSRRLLVQAIQVFREPLEQNISDKVDVSKSYREVLRDLALSHRTFLSDDDWTRIEAMLTKIDEGSKDHEFNDMEIVRSVRVLITYNLTTHSREHHSNVTMNVTNKHSNTGTRTGERGTENESRDTSSKTRRLEQLIRKKTVRLAKPYLLERKTGDF